MQYHFPIFLLLFFITTHSTYAGNLKFDRNKGYFGYTRACLKDMNDGHDFVGGCISSFIPLVVIDSITFPVESIINMIESQEEQRNSSETSSKNSSQSDSSQKDPPKKEISEERKTLNKLSLFMQVADDAREYLAHQTKTPLLESAVYALHSLYPEMNSEENFTQEATVILKLEDEILKKFEIEQGVIQ